MTRILIRSRTDATAPDVRINATIVRGTFAAMPIDWDTVPPAETLGEELLELMRELFPIPRSLTGDGVRETLARARPRGAARARRDADRHAGLRLGGAARVEAPRRLDRGAGRRADRRRRRLAAARARVQHAGRRRAEPRGAARPRLHARGSRPRPVPHLVLDGAVGVLHEPRASSSRSSRATTTSWSTRSSSTAR